MRPAKMQQQKPRRLLAYSLSLCLSLSLSLSLLIGLAAGHQKQNVAWKYNDPHYDAEQYAKIFGQATGDENGKGAGQELFGPFQYQYVDHQPNCREGGQPVCATNGQTYFYFENDCKLEAHNMQLLFQHGTELELTEFDHCMPNCGNIKCNTVYHPVCAAAESGPHQGQGVTFANECEVRRRECTTKETMRFLNKGPCRQSRSKSRSKGKRKNKHNRNKSTTSSTTEETEEATTANPMPVHKKVFVMLAPEPATTLRSTSSSTSTTTTTTTTSTTTPAPMKFHQVISNSQVSVSRADKPYSVFDILDVGTDYDAIKDSSLSMYLPGIGIVTDTPPSTTSTTTTTTTTTPAPTTTTSTTTAKPSTTAAPSTSTSTTSSKNIINFIYLPFRSVATSTARPVLSVASTTAIPSTTSTTEAAPNEGTNTSSLTSESKSISNPTENSTETPKKTLEVPNENTSPVTTPITPIEVSPNATGFKEVTESSTPTNTTTTTIKTEKN